jgi:allophanate hydrolase subunit 1
MAAPRFGLACFAMALLLPSGIALAQSGPAQVDSIKDVVARLRTCWKPPPATSANPGIDITVIVSFKRDGHILGHPRITYESEQATDNDRVAYRIAVMEALQRCTPMPFTEGMAGAVAGRPFAVRFHNRKIPPQPAEKRAWLIPKIL